MGERSPRSSRTSTWSTASRRNSANDCSTGPRSSRPSAGYGGGGQGRRRPLVELQLATDTRRAHARPSQPRSPSQTAMPFDLKTIRHAAPPAPSSPRPRPRAARAPRASRAPRWPRAQSGRPDSSRAWARESQHTNEARSSTRLSSPGRSGDWRRSHTRAPLDEPSASQDRILRGRRGHDDAGRRPPARALGRLGAGGFAERPEPLGRSAPRQRPLERRDCGRQRRELTLRLPAALDQSEARRALASEIPSGDSARRARANLAETIRLDHRGEPAVGE